jgi:hypothetical protein
MWIVTVPVSTGATKPPVISVWLNTGGDIGTRSTCMATRWKLIGERSLEGPFAGDSAEQLVASLLPSGPRMLSLDRALAEDVAAAVLYLQHKRGIHQVCLQCFQRCEDGEPPFLPNVTHMPVLRPCAPAGNCGWSFFVVEKTLEDGHAAVQAYVFHE